MCWRIPVQPVKEAHKRSRARLVSDFAINCSSLALGDLEFHCTLPAKRCPIVVVKIQRRITTRSSSSLYFDDNYFTRTVVEIRERYSFGTDIGSILCLVKRSNIRIRAWT